MNDLRNASICVQLFHKDDDIHADISNQIQSNTFSAAIFLKGTLWSPGDTITISFMPSDPSQAPKWYDLSQVQPRLTPAQMDIERRARAAPTLQDAIKMVVTEMVQPAVPKIKLQFVDGGGMVRVRLQAGGGSSSMVGKQCLTVAPDDFTMTFAWMDVATIMHEFTHVLSQLHEHQNPAGGISWNREAVYAWAAETQGWDKQTTDVNILNSYATNQITGSIFDPDSIMLYWFSPELTLNHQGTKQNLRYSETDIKYLASTYDSQFNPALVGSGPVSAAAFSKTFLSSPWTWIILAVVVVAALLLFLL